MEFKSNAVRSSFNTTAQKTSCYNHEISFLFSCNIDNKQAPSHQRKLRQWSSVSSQDKNRFFFWKNRDQIPLLNQIFSRSVRLGDAQSFTDYRVIRMESHPGAQWTAYEDYLAVLFLEHEVEFTGTISISICFVDRFARTTSHLFEKLRVFCSLNYICRSNPSGLLAIWSAGSKR